MCSYGLILLYFLFPVNKNCKKIKLFLLLCSRMNNFLIKNITNHFTSEVRKPLPEFC